VVGASLIADETVAASGYIAAGNGNGNGNRDRDRDGR